MSLICTSEAYNKYIIPLFIVDIIFNCAGFCKEKRSWSLRERQRKVSSPLQRSRLLVQGKGERQVLHYGKSYVPNFLHKQRRSPALSEQHNEKIQGRQIYLLNPTLTLALYMRKSPKIKMDMLKNRHGSASENIKIIFIVS